MRLGSVLARGAHVSAPLWTVALGDAVEVVRAMPRESVDLWLLDPAYESLEKHRGKGTTTRLAVSDSSSNEWFPIFRNRNFADLLHGMYAALRPERHTYIVCDEETCDLVKPIAENVGFYAWKSVIWVKTLSASIGKPEGEPTASTVAAAQVRRGMGYHFANSTERVLFLEKRSKRYEPPALSFGLRFEPRPSPPGTGRRLRVNPPDVIFAPRVTGYPTEKPVELLSVLVEASTDAGEIVADPFCGSGSTGEAAVRLGRRVLLSDITQKAVDHTTARLRALESTT